MLETDRVNEMLRARSAGMSESDLAVVARLVALATERGESPAGEALVDAALVVLGVDRDADDDDSDDFTVRLEMTVTAESAYEAARYFLDDAGDATLGARSFDIRRGGGPWRRHNVDPADFDA